MSKDSEYDAKIAAAAKAAPVTSSPIVDEQTKIQGARDAIAAATAAGIPTVAPTTVTSTRSGITAAVGTGLATVIAAQNAAAEADAKLKASTEPKTPAPEGTYYQWHPFSGGGGEWRTINIPGYVKLGSGVKNPADGSGAGVYSGSGSAADPFTLDGKPFSGSLGGVNYSNGVIVKSGGSADSPVVVPPGGSINANTSALQIITDALKQAGLPSLAANAWTMWNKGFDFNAIMDDPVNGIRASADYKKVFPAMATLNAMGEGITEGQYLDKVAADKEILAKYNLPPGIFDTPDYLGSLMINHVNTVNLEKRLIAIQDSVLSLDPNVVKYAKDVFGLDAGHLMAWAADPKLALPVIQQQAEAMKIGGAAFAAGLAAQDITRTEAESLAAAGVTQQQAQQGFTNIAQMGQYKQALPGANPAETLTNEELINAQFATSPDAIMKLNKAKQSKLSEFAQGGQFAATQAGVVGLGNAPVI